MCSELWDFVGNLKKINNPDIDQKLFKQPKGKSMGGKEEMKSGKDFVERFK